MSGSNFLIFYEESSSNKLYKLHELYKLYKLYKPHELYKLYKPHEPYKLNRPMLEIILKGGFLIYPLILCSILALAVICERLFALRRTKILPREIVQLIESYSDDQDANLIMRVCTQNNGVLARVVWAAVKNRYLSRDELKEIIQDTGRRETRTLQKYLVVLETVAAVAPLLGLLGTVTGMIRTFTVIAEYGVGQAGNLSGGISEALITTAVGLSIGIPALIAYNYFIHHSENLILDIEEHSATLVCKLKRPADFLSEKEEMKNNAISTS